MTFTAKPVIIVSLTIIGFLLSLSEEELFAQQRGTISVDRAVALPLTTTEGNQVSCSQLRNRGSVTSWAAS